MCGTAEDNSSNRAVHVGHVHTTANAAQRRGSASSGMSGERQCQRIAQLLSDPRVANEFLVAQHNHNGLSQCDSN